MNETELEAVYEEIRENIKIITKTPARSKGVNVLLLIIFACQKLQHYIM